MERTTVHVHARDPISKAGVASQLRPRPEVRVVGDEEADQARVAVVVVDSVDDDAIHLLHIVQRCGDSRTVLVAGRLDDGDLVTAVEAGVVGLVRRSEATPERLVKVITGAASGEGAGASGLVGRLLDQVGALARGVLGPRGVKVNGLAAPGGGGGRLG